MAATRKIIEINETLCDGCGQCVTSCAEGAIQIIDGKAKLVSDIYCDGLGACLAGCPQDALKIIEREAPEFDLEAAEEHVRRRDAAKQTETPKMACGCPSSQIRMFKVPDAGAKRPVAASSGQDSALRQWPVQIRLVPSNAPFLKDAELLVAADCSTVAYPNVHRDFLPGKVILIGCPKFDDAPGYLKKFEEIFRTAGIRRVTVLSMEVPCCSGLPVLVKKAVAASGKTIPVEEVVIGLQGNILSRVQLHAA